MTPFPDPPPGITIFMSVQRDRLFERALQGDAQAIAMINLLLPVDLTPTLAMKLRDDTLCRAARAILDVLPSAKPYRVGQVILAVGANIERQTPIPAWLVDAVAADDLADLTAIIREAAFWDRLPGKSQLAKIIA